MEILTLLNSYLRHESDFRTITEYLSPTEGHDQVYSIQIARHLLNSGIAFESICKKIGGLKNEKPGNIGAYKHLILKEFPRIVDFEVQLSLNGRIIKPFEDWSFGNLKWWQNYTDLKHSYFENLSKGCFGESLKAFSAYLVLILYFGYLENKKKYPDIPSMLAPSLLIPKDHTNSTFDNGGMHFQYPVLL